MDLESWVASLPEGLHARIGEKGAKISGGQRQRLAIARTLYQEPEILLLDEVTNQLDPQTEKEVITTLLNLADQNRTILMITHHPELLKKFETVYELVGGVLDKVQESTFQSAE
jgi:ABC-type bacteriocin/lantibiotic exporter with double-glycine peptidase domain